jgi:hypothetical protein
MMECPPGFVKIDNNCSKCYDFCLTCVDSRSNCIYCGKDYFYDTID